MQVFINLKKNVFTKFCVCSPLLVIPIHLTPFLDFQMARYEYVFEFIEDCDYVLSNWLYTHMLNGEVKTFSWDVLLIIKQITQHVNKKNLQKSPMVLIKLAYTSKCTWLYNLLMNSGQIKYLNSFVLLKHDSYITSSSMMNCISNYSQKGMDF